MGSSFASLVTPFTDRLWAAYFTKRESECETCKAALDRIREEKPKFEHIVGKKPYNNAAHEKAFTRTSFELLGKAMNQLSGVRKFCRAATNLAGLCEQRDAVGVLALIKQLEPRLEKHTRGMKVKEGDAVLF